MCLRFANYWQTMHKAITKQNKVFASFHLCAVIIFVFCTLSVFSNSYYISHSQNLFHCFLCHRPAVLLCLWYCIVLQTMVSGMKHSLLECLEVRDLQSCCATMYICYWIRHFLLALKVCGVLVYYKFYAIFEPFGGILQILFSFRNLLWKNYCSVLSFFI